MNRLTVPLLALVLTLLAGCGGSGSSSTASVPLSADNLNLIFVLSPDLAHHADGDIQPDTANLTSQGLQRSLLMATYLQQQVLGMNNASAIYAITPMTHLQTVNNYPDMSSLGTIQQFALLNRIALPVDATRVPYSASSYPINAAYAQNALPGMVTPPVAPPAQYCPDCSGLDFNNTKGNNDTLVSAIIDKKVAGFTSFLRPGRPSANCWPISTITMGTNSTFRRPMPGRIKSMPYPSRRREAPVCSPTIAI